MSEKKLGFFFPDQNKGNTDTLKSLFESKSCLETCWVCYNVMFLRAGQGCWFALLAAAVAAAEASGGGGGFPALCL